MEKSSNELLKGIDTVILRVADLNASRDWYMNKLGLAVMFEDYNSRLVVFNTNGSTSLSIWEGGERASISRGTNCYPIFRTDDIEALHRQLIVRGVETGEVCADQYVKYFHFYDPDGNMMEACAS